MLSGYVRSNPNRARSVAKVVSLDKVLLHRQLSQSSNALPVVLVCAMGALDLAWNLFVHLEWNPSTTIFAGPAYICLALFVICKIVWPNKTAMELFLFLGLWVLFAIFASQLSYLAATLDLPLRDHFMMKIDSRLGFDWLFWFNFVWAHPLVSKTFVFAYESYFFQPVILIAILSFARMHGRNREFLVSMILSVMLVIGISAILPAYGPPHAYGIATGWDETLTDLRQGAHVSYGYVGIVTFPSFHACVAVLFTLAMRGHLLALMAAAMLTGIMLVSILPLGGHYLVDLIAGSLIALLAFWAAQATNDLWTMEDYRNASRN